MNHRRLIVLLAGACALNAVGSAAAHDKRVLDARDVAHCMKARMKSDRGESYQEAFKVCKQQQDGANSATAMNAADLSGRPKP